MTSSCVIIRHTARAAFGAALIVCAVPAGPAAAAEGIACANLAGVEIPAETIGLPTRGAHVTATEAVAAAGSGPAAIGAYCKVTAEIRPVDPAAPMIRMIVNLPDVWNHKALMLGGGGYDGTIPATNGNVPTGPVNTPVPLAQGYATFSSDSGHQANELGALDGSFGANAEAVRNFSADALKKTHDVAMTLIKAHYAASGVKRAYFIGHSSGGREALAVAQRWPADWDGVVSLYPAWNAASLDLQFGRITRALAAPGAYPDQAKRKRLYDAAMEACDGLDGVKDGLISNVEACNARFDPATATVAGKLLRCEGGADTGDDCLSDAQIKALKVYDSAISFPYAPASGETGYPGFNIWGSDLGMINPNPAQARVIALALGKSRPAHPMPKDAPFGAIFWDQWARFFVTNDPDFDSLSLDPQAPGKWTARISELTKIQDINETNLSAFAKRGGKLILLHGKADVLVSTRATEQYYVRMQAAMGPRRVHDFTRFYEVPGFGHALSTVFNASWDPLGVLDRWVETGKAPKTLVVADTIGVPGRTRPLCDYPSWPRYRGTGDVNKAGSFVCATK